MYKEERASQHEWQKENDEEEEEKKSPLGVTYPSL